LAKASCARLPNNQLHNLKKKFKTLVILTDFPYFLEDFAKFLKSQNCKQDFPFSTKKRLGNLCFSEPISTNFIAKFSSLEISKSKNTTTEDAARDGRRRNAPSR
jgi:hypothetical protein